MIGCESITPLELDTLRAKSENKVSWNYETVTPNGKQVFLGPLIYLFKTVAVEGKPNLAAIVQFKNHDMAGNFERDQMIKGTVRYEITNPQIPESITLTSLICADSLVFDIAQLTSHKPYLILHPQLNFEPYNIKMIDFRCKLFGGGNGHLYEVISLNWAKGFSVKDYKTSSDKGGTAYFMHPLKETEPNQTDSVIDKNYKNGVYLNFSQKFRYSAYLFSTLEVVFIFDSTKTSQFLAPAENRERTGLSSLPPYTWNGTDFEHSTLVDEIQQIFEGNGGKTDIRPSERQKLLAISIGNISPSYVVNPTNIPRASKERDYPIYWHMPRNLEPYRLGGSECPEGFFAKLLDAQVTCIANAISRYFNLKVIVNDSANLPEILEDFKNKTSDILLDFSDQVEGSIRHNLKKENSKSLATGAYIGDTLPSVASSKFSDMKETLLPQRLVVWYRHNGVLKYITDEHKLVTNGTDTHNDFTRE